MTQPSPCHKVVARNFTHLAQAELLLILERRNHPEVRRWMRHTEPIAVADHLRFCASLATKPEVLMLLVTYDAQPACVLTYRATDTSWQHLSDSGIYGFAPEPCSTSILARLIRLKLIALRGISSHQIKVKNTNEMALFANQYYHGFRMVAQDDEYTTLQQTYPESAAYYEAQAQELMRTNHLSLELEL